MGGAVRGFSSIVRKHLDADAERRRKHDYDHQQAGRDLQRLTPAALLALFIAGRGMKDVQRRSLRLATGPRPERKRNEMVSASAAWIKHTELPR
jgi:hypothetical protein